MALRNLLTFFTLTPLVATGQQQQNQKNQQKHLTATAIVNTPDNASSTLQCWRLTQPLSPPSKYSGDEPGALNLALADTTNTTFVTRPAGESYGLHNAPYAQIVAYLSGTVNITVPSGEVREAVLQGGKNGIFFAMDTQGEGHYAAYPGDEETVGLMIPLVDGKAPAYEVLSERPCGVSGQVV